MKPLLLADGLALPGRLHGATLALAAGELVALVGPNGGGKTSLLHALAGIGGPSGTVELDGVDPRRLARPWRIRMLAFLPASRDVRWPLRARDAIALGGATPAEIDQAMAELELEAFADRRIDLLSTGERSRVLIARALAPGPKLLLLDEPTANLDPLWQIRLMEQLRDRLKRTGQAALIAMHDLDGAERYADRLIVIDQGRIAADGAPSEILQGPCMPAVFGIERVGGSWRPVRPPADRRSSP